MARPKVKVTLQQTPEPEPQTVTEPASGASTASFPIKKEAQEAEAAVIARELGGIRNRRAPRPA